MRTEKKYCCTSSEEKLLTFWEHAEELRWIIIRSLLLVVLIVPVAYWNAPYIMDAILGYCATDEFSLQYFTLMEPFFVQLKIAFVLAMFIAFPYITYQFWKFVLPALTVKEKKHVAKIIFVSIIMFGTGVFFAIFLVLPMVIRFSLSFQRASLNPMLGINNFVNMILIIMLAFGLVFQTPVVVSVFIKLGVLKKAMIAKQRPLIIVIISVISAILTPPDFLSQLIMGIPTYLLFEIALLVSSEPKNIPPNCSDTQE